MRSVGRWLQHPLTRGLSVDDPMTTALRREIILSKPLLRRIYLEWYRLVRESLPVVEGPVVKSRVVCKSDTR